MATSTATTTALTGPNNALLDIEVLNAAKILCSLSYDTVVFQTTTLEGVKTTTTTTIPPLALQKYTDAFARQQHVPIEQVQLEFYNRLMAPHSNHTVDTSNLISPKKITFHFVEY